ncbi:hypothetical protein ACIBL6_47585 [Streptomyces sp. NPDC050400]|uniref:hypothetical protein n=1 Tax=Streptomyces sp. NPDC050400 TaxID=3365610 RepID=UPI00379CB54C
MTRPVVRRPRPTKPPADVDEPPALGIVPQPGQLLDWHDSWHWHYERPCVLCHRPTHLRSHDREPVHKVCAEQWISDHPVDSRAGRFVSDVPRKPRQNIHA